MSAHDSMLRIIIDRLAGRSITDDYNKGLIMSPRESSRSAMSSKTFRGTKINDVPYRPDNLKSCSSMIDYGIDSGDTVPDTSFVVDEKYWEDVTGRSHVIARSEV